MINLYKDHLTNTLCCGSVNEATQLVCINPSGYRVTGLDVGYIFTIRTVPDNALCHFSNQFEKIGEIEDTSLALFQAGLRFLCIDMNYSDKRLKMVYDKYQKFKQWNSTVDEKFLKLI